MKVVCHTLSGQIYEFTFMENTPIGKVMLEIGKSERIAPLNQLKFIHKGKLLELCGLNTCIKNLADFDILNIHITLRLGAAPVSLGNLRYKYWAFVISILENGKFTDTLDTEIKDFYTRVIELENLYRNIRERDRTNDSDPITNEPVTNPMEWLENDIKYAMNYYSLQDYVQSSKFTDENGIVQIPSPFTKQPIPEPWRTDFLANF